MSIHTDFKFFVDGGTLVPYYVDGAKYFIKPTVYKESFTFEFKQFFKTNTYCCIGVPFSKMVRKISVKEYEEAKFFHNLKLDNREDLRKRVQLTFF